MATSGKNLSHYIPEKLEINFNWRIAICVSEWNEDITNNLMKGAIQTLLDLGMDESRILVHTVPGSYELPLGAQYLIEFENTDAVICLGNVIQGETKHFDFVCEAVAQGIKDVSLKHNVPVVFGVLTDNTKQQSIDRSGGKHGNKGVEAAVVAVKMLMMRDKLKK